MVVRQRLVACVCAGWVVVVMSGPAAIAQSASGGVNLDARCGGSLSNAPMAFGDDLAQARHGECPAPGNGGLASINDAAAAWTIRPGLFVADTNALTGFLGTHDDAGTASGLINMIVQASDLMFTNIANPAQTGTITVGGMHYEFGGIVLTQGLSNCNPFQPYARATYDAALGPCHVTGARTLEPDFGVLTSGGFDTYANDGSLVHLTSTGGAASLAAPSSFYLQLFSQTSVLYCDSPPAAVGEARARVVWRLPCGRPIFDLPAGFTADSVSLRIVRNFSHAPDCCPADVDDGSGAGTPDGGVDINDLLYFLAQYEAGSASVDLDDGSGTWTPDGGVDINDLLFFLAHYEGGC